MLLELGRAVEAVEAFDAALTLEPGDMDLAAFRENAKSREVLSSEAGLS